MQTKDNRIQMQASFTPQTLADSLSLDISTLKRAMTRMDFYYGKDDPLPTDVVREVIAAYARPHPRRPEEVVESAQEIAHQFNIQINIGNQGEERKPKLEIAIPPAPLPAQKPETPPAPLPAPKPETPPAPLPAPKPETPPAPLPTAETRNQKRDPNPFVTILVYLAFVFILLFQMEHVASIGMAVSSLGSETARKVSGWLFAFTFNLTALLMTLRRGISAVIHFAGQKVSYILLFAILDMVFFVMSAAPMGALGDGALIWAKALLVGSATAFVIYSFNELLTERQ